MPLPWRNAELKSGSVVILRPRIGVSSIVLAVEPTADLRVGAHALGRAVDRDLGLLRSDEQLHPQRRRLAGAQRDVLARPRRRSPASTRRPCRSRSATAPANVARAVATGRGLARRAGLTVGDRSRFASLHDRAGLIGRRARRSMAVLGDCADAGHARAPANTLSDNPRPHVRRSARMFSSS